MVRLAALAPILGFLAGVAVAAAGAGLAWLPAGFIVAGAGLVVLFYEPGKDKPS